MDGGYRVPFQDAEREFTEKRSRFIGAVFRVEDEDAARRRIEEVRRKYHDARHHCWCYVIREGGIVRYSDAGEPQGTAGQPMLNVLQRREVTNACCVVTRYFGGVLLGAGGLTRAYSRAARDALDAAGTTVMGLWTLWELSCPYGLLERVKTEVAACRGTVQSADYGAEARLRLALPEGGGSDAAASCAERLRRISAGALVMEAAGEAFLPGARE